MKAWKLYLLSSFLILTSCEEVIEVDLEESEPRLVVEASIIWLKGSTGNQQSIRLSKTSPFYQEEVEPVLNAEVNIYSANGREFNFSHSGNGVYISNTFEPILNQDYYLELTYNDQLYTATERMMPVTDIDYVEQSNSGGFTGDDIEIKAYYTDPADQENYYLFKFLTDDLSLEFYEDEFTNGNQIFGYYSDEDLEKGDEIDIFMEGISRDYFEYLFILRSQVGNNGGGPFETMPATVKGNVINQSNREDYPFGYFRLSQADSTSYIIE
ncbi:DUF4249 domain-containing protein [Gramella sp. BOM4]|nr:DUF4249 domain-containing protein [Christiangramia bathymodioli]